MAPDISISEKWLKAYVSSLWIDYPSQLICKLLRSLWTNRQKFGDSWLKVLNLNTDEKGKKVSAFFRNCFRVLHTYPYIKNGYCCLWLVTTAQPSTTTSSPFFSSTKNWSDVFYSLVIFPFGATNCQFPHSQGISLFPPSFLPFLSLSCDLAGLALCTIKVRQAACAAASPFILSLLARELWREMVCVGVRVCVCERQCVRVC